MDAVPIVPSLIMTPLRRPARARRESPLVAAALLARNHAAVFTFNRGRHCAATFSWADADATRSDANRDIATLPVVPVVAVAVPVASDLNIYALGHPDAIGVGRNDERSGRQDRCGCYRGKSDLQHVGVPP